MPGVLAPVLGFPVQESYEDTGGSAVKAHKFNRGKIIEGLKHLTCEEKLRELGLIRQEKR